MTTLWREVAAWEVGKIEMYGIKLVEDGSEQGN